MLRRALLLAAVFAAVSATAAETPKSRHFIFHYAFSVRGVEAGKPIEVWIPLAHSDAYQDVRVVSMQSDLPLKKMREKEYDDEMLVAASKKADRPEYRLSVVYDVVRREHLADGPGERASAKELERFQQPDKLVPVTGLPAELAAKTVDPKAPRMEQAHAIYEYVFNNMRYDKTGTGWGRGDTLFACDAKRGNCTDFHSLFISMARSQKIPARFEIGFPLPADKHSGEIAGYHCWASFYDPQRGWVPVDISEAWRHPEKREYFFGAHDENRVQLTIGRDIMLNPKQEGEPRNYFVYPYVEVGGKEHANVALDFSFADVEGAAGHAVGN
jgi:transglutaminase-like putative cysteine protease